MIVPSMTLLLLAVVIVSINVVDMVTVTTQDGTYVGYIHRIDSLGRELVTHRFLGIPYAEAPIGNLRFNKPMRKEKLTKPFDASKFGHSCYQQIIQSQGNRKTGMKPLTYSEDCLVLNIFAPADVLDSTNLLPVMIWFHGGGFNIGSPTTHVSDIPSAYGNVIIVTVSYRLAIWGFLSTGDENLPGNYGLWDQQMAIEWVHDNIAYFGGDPEEVTLFGQSAGAASVVYQAMYPGNVGKIKRVIPMSGSITCPPAFNNKPLNTAKRLAALVNCDTTVTSNELADCLRSKSTEELERVLNTKANGFTEFPMQFVSVVDGDFVPESPVSLFHGSSKIAQEYRRNLQSVDLMTGVTSEEGLMLLSAFVGVEDTEAFTADRSRFETELIPYVTNIVLGEDLPQVVHDLVAAEYTNWTDPDNSFNSRKSYVTLSGDYVFNIQTIETVLLHAGGSDKNTYLYLYDVFPSTRVALTPSWNKKPQHGDDETTFWGYNSADGYTAYTTPYIQEPFEDWETEFIKAHIFMWTNFAKTGNPNEPENTKQFTKTTWPTFDTQSRRYLHMTKQMSDDSVGSHLFARATNFWLNVLPGVVDAVENKKTMSIMGGDVCIRDGECEP